MRSLIVYLVMIMTIGCNSEKGKNTEVVVNMDTIPSFAYISVETEFPRVLFAEFLDSANKFKPEDPIPHFFYNHLLDYEHPWLTDHNTFSLRKLIIDSTINIELLKAIVMSTDLRLKKIVDSVEVSNVSLLNALPYKNLSNFDIATIKFRQLNR